MNIIYKYPLDKEIITRQEIAIPSGSKFLCCRVQHNQVTLWFAVPYRKHDNERRFFEVRVTGYPYSEVESEVYLGTCLFENGSFVVHVFEVLS